MTIKSKIESALLNFAYQIISWNSQKLNKKYPKMVIFSFDYIGNYINCYGRYENSLLQKLRRVIELNRTEPTGSALDIGANIGNHTIYFIDFFEKVFAFEPNSKTHLLLKINTAHLPNVICIDKGASSKKETLKFLIDELNMGGSMIISESRRLQDNYSEVSINVCPVDEIDEIKVEKIEFVKIDVEGHEIDVIRGMRDTIQRNNPMIAFEQSKSEIVNGSSDSIKELQSMGYKYFYSIESSRSMVSDAIPSFFRVPLQLLEILILGDKKDYATFSKIEIFDKKNYSMIIASVKSMQIP